MKTRLLYLETDELDADGLRAILSSLQLLEAPAGEPAFVTTTNGQGKSAAFTAAVEKVAAEIANQAQDYPDEPNTTPCPYCGEMECDDTCTAAIMANQGDGASIPAKPASIPDNTVPTKGKRGGNRIEWTPEKRAAQAERIRTALAAKRAQQIVTEPEPPIDEPTPIQEAQGVFERIKGSLAVRTDRCIEEIVDHVRTGGTVTVDWVDELIAKYGLPNYQVRDLVEQAQQDARAAGISTRKAVAQ